MPVCLVTCPVRAGRTAGHHSVIWQGTDDADNSVGSGVYFYRLQSGNYEQTMKMVLLR